MKTCPDCLSEIPDAATFCSHCGERVEGKACSDCGVRNWEDAVVCRWCGFKYEKQAPAGLSFQPFMVLAKRLPTILQRGRLLPQSIDLTREKITIATPGIFNLYRKEEEIPWAKVAGFDYSSGIFWDRIEIQTRGQSAAVIGCLNKAEGQRIRAVLQQLEI